MGEKKKVDPLQFDKRVMSRFVKSGHMTQKDLDSHLDNLEDKKSVSEDFGPKIYGERKQDEP